MKAVVHDTYGSPDVLELRDIEPPVPRDGEVLLRVHAAGVERGVWHLLTGLPHLVRVVAFGQRPAKSPVRGWEVAGRVESLGPNVTGLQPGDEVYGTGKGTFAEYACAKADELAPKPPNLSFEQAATVPVSGGSALQGLRDQGQVSSGQRVLITGAGGGVGTFAVQLAKAFGAEVTGVCGTAKVDLVRSLGAERVIDRTREDFADGRERHDLIVDTAGIRPLPELRRALAPEGTVVLVGGEGGGRWLGGFQRQIFFAPLASLRGRQRFRALTHVERRDDLLFLTKLIEAGDVTPVIDRSYPLAEVPDAIRHMETGDVRGKLVISI